MLESEENLPCCWALKINLYELFSNGRKGRFSVFCGVNLGPGSRSSPEVRSTCQGSSFSSLILLNLEDEITYFSFRKHANRLTLITNKKRLCSCKWEDQNETRLLQWKNLQSPVRRRNFVHQTEPSSRLPRAKSRVFRHRRSLQNRLRCGPCNTWICYLWLYGVES